MGSTNSKARYEDDDNDDDVDEYGYAGDDTTYPLTFGAIASLMQAVRTYTAADGTRHVWTHEDLDKIWPSDLPKDPFRHLRVDVTNLITIMDVSPDDIRDIDAIVTKVEKDTRKLKQALEALDTLWDKYIRGGSYALKLAVTQAKEQILWFAGNEAATPIQ